MFKSKTVLSQIQSYIFGYDFKKIVNEYNGDKRIRVFSIKNLFSVMLYSHIASKDSLRDITDSLKSKRNLWYHLGLKSLSRNNLSYALKNRSNKIFEKTFFMLLSKLYNERSLRRDKRFRFKMPIRSIDSTTIKLCLSLFDWAKFRKKKGGIKLHVMFNNKEQIPEVINFSNAGKHDITMKDSFPITENSIYVFDKGYICFEFLQKINKNMAFFVTRTKTNTKYKIVRRQQKKQKTIKADWIVLFSSYKSKDYPEHLRVVRYYDKETRKTYEFMTNNFELSAKTIADIYKSRWDIELFFKWIKQNLNIKTFLGTSENAVKIQIWVAMIAYLLMEYIKYKTKSSFSKLKIFRILRENLLTHVDLFQLLSENSPPNRTQKCVQNLQLVFSF